MTSNLESAIRKKLFELTEARLQSDLGPMAASLRAQGASEAHIRDSLEGVIEHHADVMCSSARDMAAKVAKDWAL